MKVIEWISAICVAISMCLMCSIEISPEQPISTFIWFYGILLLIMMSGAFGLWYSYDPYPVNSKAYGLKFAIVNTVYTYTHNDRQSIQERTDYSLSDNFFYYYDMGLDDYDEGNIY